MLLYLELVFAVQLNLGGFRFFMTWSSLTRTSLCTMVVLDP